MNPAPSTTVHAPARDRALPSGPTARDHTPRPSGHGRAYWAGLALLIGVGAAPLWAQAAPPAADTPAVASSDLDAELFYQLLLGEMQLQQDDPGAAFSLLHDAANRTHSPELYRRAVEIALQGRAGNAALTAVRDWARAHPEQEAPQRYELQILLALNRPADIGPSLRQLIRLAPAERRNEVIAAIPQTLARTQDKAAALQAAQAALRPSLADPATAVAAWVTLGRLQLAGNAPSDALRSAQEAQARQPGAPSAAALALELFEREQAGAQALFQAFLRTPAAASGSARAPLHLGYVRLLLEQRRWDDAAAELAQLQQTTPAPAETWLLQAALDLQQRRPQAADSALRSYLERTQALPAEDTQAGRTQALLQLALIAEQRQDYAAANAWLDRIDSGADILAVQVRRASVLARQGQLDQARQLLRHPPARTDAEQRRQWLAEAQLLRDVGQPGQAYAVYTEAAARFPDDADLAYERAMAADKAGQPHEMEQQLRALIARHPDFHHAHNALGYALADRNVHLAEAKTLIQRALAQAPADPYILDSLGWVEFRLGHLTEARRILRDAYQRRPDAEIAAHLGEVHWAMQERDAALSVWREGLFLSPDNATLRQTLERLQVRP